ncbi:MAG: hypothetical protein PHF44_03830 [Candidatus Pacebacteria bacterium]|nr:hypothetical protein [Candidatus Paceibacterota bacterium]
MEKTETTRVNDIVAAFPSGLFGDLAECESYSERWGKILANIPDSANLAPSILIEIFIIVQRDWGISLGLCPFHQLVTESCGFYPFLEVACLCPISDSCPIRDGESKIPFPNSDKIPSLSDIYDI